ncbi:hypothetical protein B0H14DRAFT_2625027 [Mycena olivaceomarginata]|nr:hypothetical protein B0H14DRAFT_2625027 [Mycena olivaceomarginata]
MAHQKARPGPRNHQRASKEHMAFLPRREARRRGLHRTSLLRSPLSTVTILKRFLRQEVKETYLAARKSRSTSRQNLLVEANLLSDFHEASANITESVLSGIILPGISVPGKLLIAQISKGLGPVVLMVGVIGRPEPLFSCPNWSDVKTEVDAKTRSITMNLVNCTPSGPLFRVDSGIVQVSQPGIQLRIVFEEQATFWALAYLSVKISSDARCSTPLSFSIEEQRHITMMLEYFKRDDGPEFCSTGSGAEAINSDEENPPPGYTGSDAVPPSRPLYNFSLQTFLAHSPTMAQISQTALKRRPDEELLSTRGTKAIFRCNTLVLANNTQGLRARLAIVRTRQRALECQVNAKHLQRQRIKAEINNTSVQLQAQTQRLQMLESALETLAAERQEMLKAAELCAQKEAYPSHAEVIGKYSAALCRRQKNVFENVVEDKRQQYEAGHASLQRSYETEKGRLGNLLEKALSETVEELEEVSRGLVLQFLQEIRRSTFQNVAGNRTQYESEVNVAQMQLQLKSAEGEVLRHQNQAQVVSCELQAIQAQTAVVMREQEDQEKYVQAETKLLEQRLENHYLKQATANAGDWPSLGAAELSQEFERRVLAAEKSFRSKYLEGFDGTSDTPKAEWATKTNSRTDGYRLSCAIPPTSTSHTTNGTFVLLPAHHANQHPQNSDLTQGSRRLGGADGANGEVSHSHSERLTAGIKFLMSPHRRRRRAMMQHKALLERLPDVFNYAVVAEGYQCFPHFSFLPSGVFTPRMYACVTGSGTLSVFATAATKLQKALLLDIPLFRKDDEDSRGQIAKRALTQ